MFFVRCIFDAYVDKSNPSFSPQIHQFKNFSSLGTVHDKNDKKVLEGLTSIILY